MSPNEPEQFLQAWELEAQRTIKLLKTLPVDEYDSRPDPEGRSLGELAWHLAEVDAYISHWIDTGKFDLQSKPPDIERPRTIEALAPGYERIHREAVARIKRLEPEDFDRRMLYLDGVETRIGDLLWSGLLHHLIHHRGQLALMCRLAGGVPPGLYGPTREETAVLREQATRR